MEARTWRVGAGALALLALGGCTVGPNYQRPPVAAPAAYRGAAPARPGASSLGAEQWTQVFQDPALQALIRTALRQNYDLRIAAARILEAQEQLGVTRGAQYPAAAVVLGAAGSRSSRSKFFNPYETSYTALGLGFQWNLDFWGKYRRATEAARDQLLASGWAQRAVESSLVASVAAAYFALRAQDLQLQISQQTLASDQKSLQLTRLLLQHGAASLLDVRQAEEAVDAAAAALPATQKQVALEEDQLRVLLGENPGAIPRGRALTAQPHPAAVPAGLPAALLERRPDIREAEAQLMAFNARIGVAQAAYFPSIALTGSGGVQSIALSKLFAGPAGVWNFAGQLAQPLFAGGSLKSNVRLAEAQRQEAVLAYRQTIQQAFRQVSDALIAYRQDRLYRRQQQKLAAAAQDAARLADLRYRGGVASYLEVLDSNTRAYAAQLGLAQAELGERLDYVSLYRALGGGWQ